MRLHRLAVRAFGPFADPVEVDFDSLADAGIFLIHGATGSGKTSLLDAVCFALYGRVPGLRPAGEALRSDLAAPHDLPEVQLELTVGGRRLRVTRSPDHQRPKKRGAGVTPVRGQVHLEECRLGSSWTTVATRADDVGHSLGRALGMGLDQFAKVVLLPQGDFAAFLRASAEDRRALLERLFDVHRYTGVETWFADRRRLTAAASARAQAALAADLVRVDDVLARVPSEVTAPLPGWDQATRKEQLSEAMALMTVSLRDHALSALATSEAADHRALGAEQGLSIATATARAAARGAAAQGVLAAFDATASDRAAAVDRLARGERAGRVAGDVRALRAAEADLTSAAAGTVAAIDALTGADVDVRSSRTVGADLGDLVHLALDRALEFDAALAEVSRLEDDARLRAERLTALDEEAVRARRHLDDLDTTQLSLTTEMARLQDRADQLTGITADSGLIHEAATRTATLLSLKEHAVRISAAVADLDSSRLAATRVAAAQASRLLDLRQRRLDGMAGELAASLLPGHDCPVCGSTEHPRPATQIDGVTPADIDAAEQAWEPLERRARALESELAAARRQLADVVAGLADNDSDLPTLTSAAVAAQAAWHRAKAAAEELPRVHAQIAGIQQRRNDIAVARSSAQAAVATAEALCAELNDAAIRDQGLVRELLARHTEGCPCATAEVDQAQIPRRHREVVSLLREAAHAHADEVSARRRHTEQRQATTRVCRAEGFLDVAAVDQATLSAVALAQIRDHLARDAAAVEAARATLADSEVADALTAATPDLDALAATVTLARGQRAAAARAHALAEQAARDIEALAIQVEGSAAAAETARQTAAATAALADVVAGLGPDNTMRMKLSAFVLAGRLERVVELANERLARMDGGRFQLAHSDRLSAGGRRSGLGLVVEDQWTGQTRDTSTLSGGESFMASLALALGLADAVREESGGIDLHTLFIDEGFGSLDGESLEQVLAVLDQLRDGGRAVGVVSHVPALRDRITAQLRVEKSRRGSTVRRVTGPAA